MRWVGVSVLAAAVLASAVAVIVLRHEARLLFIALEETAGERDAAQVEWSRLQLEQAWLGEVGRIERQAMEQLDMKDPDRVRVLVRQP